MKTNLKGFSKHGRVRLNVIVLKWQRSYERKNPQAI